MARIFDGSDDGAEDTSVANEYATVTIMGWINPISFPASALNRHIIASFVEEANPVIHDKDFFLDNAGILHWQIFDGANKIIQAGSALSLNTWYHIAGVADGSNMRLYIGGAQAASTAAGNTFNVYANPKFGIGIDIDILGDGEGSTGRGNFRGGEWTLHNVGLNADEIATAAKGLSPRYIRPGSLKRYWPLWGLASPEPNIIGASGHLTLSGSPAAYNHAPVAPFTPRRTIYLPATSAGETVVNQPMIFVTC